jgi:hypothetical protein
MGRRVNKKQAPPTAMGAGSGFPCLRPQAAGIASRQCATDSFRSATTV